MTKMKECTEKTKEECYIMGYHEYCPKVFCSIKKQIEEEIIKEQEQDYITESTTRIVLPEEDDVINCLECGAYYVEDCICEKEELELEGGRNFD